MKRFQTRIPSSVAKVRLDHFLMEWMPQVLGAPVSRSLLRTLMMTGSLYVNRHRAQSLTAPLYAGTVVEVYYDEDRMDRNKLRRMETVRIDPSRILFEDEWLIIIDKPSGLPTQPTLDPLRPNLYGLMKSLLDGREKREDSYVGLHHRLDRDTSGLVLFTKQESANKGVADLFSEHRIQKTYHCVSWRSPDAPSLIGEQSFRVENHLGKAGERNGKKLWGAVTSGGSAAITDFRVIEEFRDALWVEARPMTGRTHQIRVHLSEAGLPILGDELYFPEKISLIHQAPRLMLHAGRLEFTHPLTGVAVAVESPLPSEFMGVLSGFRSMRPDST